MPNETKINKTLVKEFRKVFTTFLLQSCVWDSNHQPVGYDMRLSYLSDSLNAPSFNWEVEEPFWLINCYKRS